jgi:hypothetical protein
MWKMERRRSSRYLPDYSGADKLTRYHITHEGNIKVGVKARVDFNRSTTTWDYMQKVENQHEGYIKFQQGNYIPRVVSNYWRILNDPPLAAFERCIPENLQGLPWLHSSCASELSLWRRLIKRQIITSQIINWNLGTVLPGQYRSTISSTFLLLIVHSGWNSIFLYKGEVGQCLGM